MLRNCLHNARLQLERLEDRALLAAGTLDPGFGAGGRVVTDVPGSNNNTAHSLVLQNDGKMVVAGSASFTPNNDFLLARYNTDGSLDSTYGSGGIVVTDFNGGSDSIAAAVLQPDGKIVVAGSATEPGNPLTEVGLARYLPNGSLDSSFGTGGKVTTQFSSFFFSSASQLVLQPDSRLVIAGMSKPSTSTTAFVFARYNSDGSRDNSFKPLDGLPNAFNHSVGGLAIQPDGRLLLSGTSDSSSILIRVLPDGSLDPTFGAAGIARPDISGSITVQADGRIVVAGTVNGPRNTQVFAVERFNLNGNPDATFSGGKVLTDFGSTGDQATAVIAQPDGRIVVGGTSANNYALARYNPNGSLDDSFGAGGKLTTDFSGQLDTLSDLALQPDGKLVAAGTSLGGQKQQIALARYLGDDRLPTANQRFVAQMYLDMLRRPADPGGFSHFVGLLDQGATHEQVAQTISRSEEYRMVLVQDTYGQMLGRVADPSGLAFWTNFLGGDAGALPDVRAAFAGTPEYFQNRGGNTRDGFLAAIYRDILDRPIDPSGQQTFSQALAGGASRDSVAETLSESKEGSQVVVRHLYQHFLRRLPDPGGLDTYTNGILNGVREEFVTAILIGSQEYNDRL